MQTSLYWQKADQLFGKVGEKKDWEWGITKGPEEAVVSDRYIHYLDGGGDFTDMHKCPNVSSCIL